MRGIGGAATANRQVAATAEWRRPVSGAAFPGPRIVVGSRFAPAVSRFASSAGYPARSRCRAAPGGRWPCLRRPRDPRVLVGTLRKRRFRLSTRAILGAANGRERRRSVIGGRHAHLSTRRGERKGVRWVVDSTPVRGGRPHCRETVLDSTNGESVTASTSGANWAGQALVSGPLVGTATAGRRPVPARVRRYHWKRALTCLLASVRLAGSALKESTASMAGFMMAAISGACSVIG